MRNKIFQHNVLHPWPLPDKSVDCIVTSPPYWGLRDYGTGTWVGGESACIHDNGGQPQVPQTKHPGAAIAIISGGNRGGGKTCVKCGAIRVDEQLGLEETPEEYVAHLVQVFSEAWRVLKDTGTLWLNLGDTYWGGRGQSGGTWSDPYRKGTAFQNEMKGQTRPQDHKHADIKPKDLVGIPWMTAFALRAAGWYLRQDDIWHKPNPMPESVTDRCTKSHEYLFLLTKSRDYYYDAEAVKEQRTSNEDGNIFRGGAYTGGNINNNTCGSRKITGNKIVETTTRNKRSVWTVATVPFDGEYCTACGRYFDGPTKKLIRITEAEGKTVRTCPCGCDNAWLSHFATFPPDLIVDCVKAGTSQHGNCASCGKPWERVTKPVLEVAHDGTTESAYGKGSTANRLAVLREQGVEYTGERKTVGWQPTCACGTIEVVPAIVCDCFMGSGTTGLVAREQGRDYVGLDLNPHYIAMAEARLGVGIQAELSF